jgi:hypothetical protein
LAYISKIERFEGLSNGFASSPLRGIPFSLNADFDCCCFLVPTTELIIA